VPVTLSRGWSCFAGDSSRRAGVRPTACNFLEAAIRQTARGVVGNGLAVGFHLLLEVVLEVGVHLEADLASSVAMTSIANVRTRIVISSS